MNKNTLYVPEWRQGNSHCGNCDNTLRQDDVFCSKCGHEIHWNGKKKMCCSGLGEFGKCGRGTRTGCTGLHCRCMGGGCPEMHYVDCKEHYIHVEHIT